MTTGATAETFDEHILKIVDHFLQTVVVVDDQALEQFPADLLGDSELSQHSRPGRGRAVTTLTSVPDGGADHELDSKVVTDAFAEYGLVCSMLSPGPAEDVSEKFLMTARRADLVVLDWVLHSDIGNKTLDLVKRILASDEAPDRRRLRTIAIYTGQKELHDIADSLAQTIAAVYDDCELERSEDGFAMTTGPVRAAVFAKEHVSDLPGELESRRVSFGDLPERLRCEFATLTTGLVTGVALAALGALREDTHRILKVLSPQLDPAFLGHRAALPDPGEATLQAVMLVAAEIRSVIEDNVVGQNVDLPVLKLWLADAKRRHLPFGELIDVAKRLSPSQVEASLAHGLGTDQGAELVGDIKYGKKYFKKIKGEATKIFAATADEAAQSSADFAHRTMMRTMYSEPPRVLQLGTIVFSGDTYRLCMQPLCDSVRITEPRAFPFLPLDQVDPDGKANFVVTGDDGASWTYLQLIGSPRDLCMLSFDPAPNSAGTATQEGGAYRFTDLDGGIHRWIGELKPEFSQRAAFELAQQFARIAVDEAEFLRLGRR